MEHNKVKYAFSRLGNITLNYQTKEYLTNFASYLNNSTETKDERDKTETIKHKVKLDSYLEKQSLKDP